MYVSYDEYRTFGYETVPQERFDKYINKAGITVEQYTLGRVNREWLSFSDEDTRQLIENNKRGICEVADIIYNFDGTAVGEAGAPIKSFSNEGYSEVFADRLTLDARRAYNRNIRDILAVFFSPEQLNRRVPP